MTGREADDVAEPDTPAGSGDRPRPTDPADEPSFDAPWQARAFALAVALSEETDLEWSTVQGRLVAEIDRSTEVTADDPEDRYHRQWLAALERLLLERDVATPATLRERVDAFAAGERDAHEFVRGDPHDHGAGLEADGDCGHDH